MLSVLKNKPWWLIFSLVGIVLGWVMVTPAFELPDEQAHFGTVSYLLTENRLPGYHEPDLTLELSTAEHLLGIYRDEHGNNSYTYHPEHTVGYSSSLYGIHESQISDLNTAQARHTYTKEEAARYPALSYATYGLAVRLVDDSNLFTRLYAARLVNLLITVLSSFAVWQIGRLVFGRSVYALTLAGITVLQPMFSFVSSGVNSDNLHNCLTFWAIYLGLKLLKSGFSPTSLALSSLIVVLDLYTKPQGFITLLLVLCAAILRILKDRRYKLIGGVIAIILAVITLGWSQFLRYRNFIWIDNTRGASLFDYLHFSLNKLLSQNVVWYWGVFKWLGVVLPPVYWRVANRVVGLSVIGLLVYLYRYFKKQQLVADPASLLYLIFVSAIYAGTIFWFDWQYVKGWGFSLGIQARYFFPTLPAHLAILITGLTSLASSPKWQEYIRKMIIILFGWLQVGGIIKLASSYYDLSSISSFITQASQYKSLFAKGDWWYLWIGIYALSLTYLSFRLLINSRSDSHPPRSL